MTATITPLGLQGSPLSGFLSRLSWKPAGFKDLSPGGDCETGYGDQTKVHQGLQYLTDLKHTEKQMPYVRWATAAVPLLLEALPDIALRDKQQVPLTEIPARAFAVLKRKVAAVSPEQLGFLLSVIPVYHNTRTLKNAIWPGQGFDPSGHVMFKVAQHGMMYSLATDHGVKTNLNLATIVYIIGTAVADTVLLNNTLANCHTLGEVVVGGGLGVVILLVAHGVSRHTPLGEYAQEFAGAASSLVGKIGRGLKGELADLSRLAAA